MNILFVSINSAYFGKKHGGAETSIKLIAEKLASNNQKVSYLTFSQNDSDIYKFALKSINDVQVYSFGFAEMFRNNAIIKSARLILFESKIKNIIQSQKIDLIYCFYELEILKLLLKIKRIYPKLQIVMRMAGIRWYEECKKNPKLISEYEYCFNQIDSVNLIHSNLLNVVEAKLDELKMNVRFKHIFTGDIGTSSPIGRRNDYQLLPEKPFKMMMATRFADYSKRHDVLVEALSLMPKDQQVELVLFGSGKMKDQVQNQIDTLNQSNRITIKPFLKQESLWEEMQNTHLLCHACDHEGLSKIIIESMSNGLPVLASDVEPINKYIVEGYNGFLVQNDPQLWSNKIQEIMSDRELLNTISSQEIDYIQRNYSPDQNVKIYLEAFQELLHAGA